jgi:hypothetical protein
MTSGAKKRRGLSDGGGNGNGDGDGGGNGDVEDGDIFGPHATMPGRRHPSPAIPTPRRATAP